MRKYKLKKTILIFPVLLLCFIFIYAFDKTKIKNVRILADKNNYSNLDYFNGKNTYANSWSK